MTAAARRMLLRANAIFLLVAAGGGFASDVLGIFYARGPVASVVAAAPHAGIGLIEAPGLRHHRHLVGRADPMRAWHLTAAAVHILLGSANLVFWQIFIAGDLLVVGYVTTLLHGVFAVFQVIAATTAEKGLLHPPDRSAPPANGTPCWHRCAHPHKLPHASPMKTISPIEDSRMQATPRPSAACRARPRVSDNARGGGSATLTDWPIILIDLETEEGITGRSYSSPTPSIRCATWAGAARMVLNMVQWPQPRDWSWLAPRASAALRRLPGPVDDRRVRARHGGLGRAGQGGGVPLFVLLGGTRAGEGIQQQRSGLREPVHRRRGDELRERRLSGLKLRIGRAGVATTIATVEAVRRSVGGDMRADGRLDQGLDMGEP